MIAARIKDNIERFFDSDIYFSFRSSKVTMIAAAVTAAMLFGALFASWLSPQNPFDPAALSLMDAFTPPVWYPEGTWTYMLGTDDQGRDMLSALLYGSRVSLLVGFASIVFAMVLGIGLGLVSGYVGGATDAIIMRVADVQISFPAILIALLVDGVLRGVLPRNQHDELAVYVLVFSIGISYWVHFARTVRGTTMVEKNKEYVQAARVIGVHPWMIMWRHVLPNVMGPVLVIATVGLAVAVLLEATLSFLGVGVPPTEPSLGTLVRIGNDFLFSGEWWIVIFPGMVLATLVLAVNLLGDWLRDALNPRLR
ncbi:MAG: ABC transporter permease [Alphaproteobacteria bacterium]|jgi:peptide/nickel transport system permease protein|nr:ABC transporter permease [Rhodospirillaceae bacterium]MDP6407087.1 ABC transporter permease [Alphaproteobacteria bacterium]MDP6623597.1 ABC transporter permease [Alphaproteobacteria bacterium]|tara:strand:+ start:2328 stop:3257 length:930 start_codon:yes stop_codon:yes gene_type:complete